MLAVSSWASLWALLSQSSLPGSRTAAVCPPSALVSTRPIVCTCKYTFVLLVPNPDLFRSQRASTDNVRKASIPRLCSTVPVWRKDPRRGARSRCTPQRRLAVDKEQPLVVGREGDPWALLPPRARLSTVPGPGKEGAGSSARGQRSGERGRRGPGAGWSPSQSLAWSRLLLKWVKSLPCTNTGLSPAPPKYTESWRQSWPQYRLSGLCLLLPRRPQFHALSARGSGLDVGCGRLFPGKRLLLHQGPAAASTPSPTPPRQDALPAVPCPLCCSCSSASSSPPAPTKRPDVPAASRGCAAGLRETALSGAVSSRETCGEENTLTAPESPFQVHVTRNKVCVNTAKCPSKLAGAGKFGSAFFMCFLCLVYTDSGG